MIHQMQRIFARFVGEKCNPLSVRRPGGIAFGNRGCSRQIPNIALFSRHSKNFSARFKHRPRTRRRNPRILNLVADFDPVRPSRRQIRGNLNIHVVRFTGFWIKQINSAELFVDKNIRSSVDRFQIKAIVLQDLFHALAFGVVGEERDRPVAIGKKIDCVAHPDRIVVIGILARHFFQLKVVEPNDVDRRGLPAAIALPGILPS